MRKWRGLIYSNAERRYLEDIDRMLEKRQKIHEEELFGVRVLFLDILNLKGQWSIQV